MVPCVFLRTPLSWETSDRMDVDFITDVPSLFWSINIKIDAVITCWLAWPVVYCKDRDRWVCDDEWQEKIEVTWFRESVWKRPVERRHIARLGRSNVLCSTSVLRYCLIFVLRRCYGINFQAVFCSSKVCLRLFFATKWNVGTLMCSDAILLPKGNYFLLSAYKIKMHWENLYRGSVCMEQRQQIELTVRSSSAQDGGIACATEGTWHCMEMPAPLQASTFALSCGRLIRRLKFLRFVKRRRP